MSLNPRIMFFLFYLNRNHPIVGLFFQRFMPSMQLVEEFEAIKSKKQLDKFYLKILNQIIPSSPYLERVQIAHFYETMNTIEMGHDNKLDDYIKKCLSLNDDWRDDSNSLSGFMFYDEYIEKNIEIIKINCLKKSYYSFILYKKVSRVENMSEFILKIPGVREYLRDLKNRVDIFQQKIANNGT